jgi:hypothetical protein
MTLDSPLRRRRSGRKLRTYLLICTAKRCAKGEASGSWSLLGNSTTMVGMRPRSDTALRLSLAFLAAGGTILSHSIAYRFLSPDETHHRDLLGVGQQYWPFITAAVMAAVAVLIADITCRRLRSAGPRSPTSFYTYVALRLVSLQLSGFIFMELGEVISGGRGLDEFGQISILAGLSMQVIFALCAALLLILLTQAVDFVIALVSPRRLERSLRSTGSQIIPRILPARSSIWAGARPLRAPPS